MSVYLQSRGITNTVNSEIFAKLRICVIIKSSQNSEITLSFTDKGKSRSLSVANMSFKLFAKIKFSRKFPDLQ